MVDMQPVSKEELESLLGRPLADYDITDFPVDFASCMMHPKELVDIILARGIRTEYKDIHAANDGTFKSGEVWLGSYGVVYMYVGQLAPRRDVLVTLGGDTPDEGLITVDDINSDRFGLYRRLFPK